MKCFLPLVLLALALLIASCSPTRNPSGETSDAGKSPPTTPPGDGRPLPAWSPEVPQAVEISGQKIEKSADGPWEVRRTASRVAATSTGVGFRSLALSSDGAIPAPGDAVAAPVPAEAARGGALAKSAPEVSFAAGAAGASEGVDSLAVAGEPGAAGRGRFATKPGSSAALAPGKGDPASLAEESAPEAREVQAPLRAGSTDDNAEFEKFLQFLASLRDRKDVAAQIDFLDVSDRRFIKVVNRQGKPVPAARVQVVDEAADRTLLSATTHGDGRAPLYLRVPMSRPTAGAPAASLVGSSLLVEASLGEARKRVAWDGKGEELTIEIDVAEPAKDPIALDVLFLIDTTGSMGDEIQRIKATLLGVTKRLRSIEREFDLRYGAVLYKDLGDEYVTKVHPFTGDIEAFDRALKPVGAGGGGDEPESLNQGLAEAVRMDFRQRAAKVMFLIADAAPHMEYPGDVRYGESLKAAVNAGIRIHSVAASGLSPTGTFVFRQIAQYTRGKFIFIEYGSTAASAAAHGVEGKVSANNLDDIIFEQIREEVARWGRN